jgi:hypothetical protein
MTEAIKHDGPMCGDDWALDLSHSGPTKGEPFFGHGDRIFCPKCLHEITDDPGYGLAYGGMGTYWVCEQDDCDWFFKQMDRDEE